MEVSPCPRKAVGMAPGASLEYQIEILYCDEIGSLWAWKNGEFFRQ
jgi:hypothetical protein